MDLCKTTASDEDVLNLFGNVSELLDFHSHFLELFKEKYQYLTPARFETLIRRHFNCTELYSVYAATNRQITASKDELSKRYPQLSATIQVFNM